MIIGGGEQPGVRRHEAPTGAVPTVDLRAPSVRVEGHFISRRYLYVVAGGGWQDRRLVVLVSPRSRNGRERYPGDDKQSDESDDSFVLQIAHKLIPLLISGWSSGSGAGNRHGIACSPGVSSWPRRSSRFLTVHCSKLKIRIHLIFKICADDIGE